MSPPAPTFQARRRNISTACTACQACKTKCNGARPQCSRCASRATPCTYQSSDDKRRLSVKTAVDAFVRRIACLEASIHAANLPLPSVSENDELIMRRAKQLHATKPDRHSPPAGPSAPASTTTRPAFPPTSDVSDSAGDNLADHASDIPRAAFFSGPDHGVMSAEDHDDEDDEGLLDDISNRMGDLHLMGDGQLRYYGATSNFNLISPLCSSFHEDIPLGQAPQVSRASLDEPMESTLEQHLEDLYFTWADPTFHVIDRRMYHDSKVLWASGQQSNTFYSPALTSAICAIGALFSHQHRQPKQFAEMFATRAKALLEADLNTPKVATVQALVVLSTFEAGATRDPRGWLYSGMAMRLAFDLGLHVDLTPMVQRGTLTVREEYARRTAFWGSYVVDHLWGFYLGRPFHVHAGNTTVKKPSGTHLEGASWHVDGAAQGSSAKDAGEEPSDHVELISYQWVLLCECMDALSNKLYGCSTVSQPDLVRVAEESLKSVQSWKQSLPSNLSIDLADESVCYLPHLYILHMQYYQILIYIHRPFISNQRVPKDSSTRIRLPHARRSCIEAALSVARLIKMYDTSHTLGRINIQAVSIIFSAALMLLYAKLSSFPPFPQSILAKHLEICSRSLAEIGKYYENASRSLDLLLSIKRDWQARVITGPLHGKVDKASPPVPPVAVANMTETSDGGSLNLNNDLADFTDFENSFTNGSAPFAGVDLHYFNDVSVWHGTFQEASPTNQYEIDPSSNWMVLDGLSGF